MRSRWEPFDREKRFMESVDLKFIQRALWPLLAIFILLSFSDTLTTVVAAELAAGFVEFNPLGSLLFGHGPSGYLIAYGLKFVPIVPLFYLVAFQKKEPKYDFQVRLLKFTAFVVLTAMDIGFGAIVIGNNLPQLLKLLLA